MREGGKNPCTLPFIVFDMPALLPHFSDSNFVGIPDVFNLFATLRSIKRPILRNQGIIRSLENKCKTYGNVNTFVSITNKNNLSAIFLILIFQII